MAIETENDVIALKRRGKIVSMVLHEMLAAVEPGMTTRELDALGEELLIKHGARSAPKLTYDFPGYTGISINEEAAHGIPGDRVIRTGDGLNVDVSAELGGYLADTGGTRVVPPTNPQKNRLCHATRTALERAMKQARAGQPINGIGAAIERTANQKLSRASAATAWAAHCTKNQSTLRATLTAPIHTCWKRAW